MCCKLCPYYGVNTIGFMKDKCRMCLLRHVNNRHTKKRRQGEGMRITGGHNFVAAGRKQFDVIKALLDNDKLSQRPKGKYLERSARILREHTGFSTQPMIAPDRFLIKCLTADGPSYKWKSKVIKAGSKFRLCGLHAYDKKFAELAWAELLMCKARMKPMQMRLKYQFAKKGNPLALRLPVSSSIFWSKLLEDIISSPAIAAIRGKFMDRAYSNGEFHHISGDGLLRQCRRLRGQVDYRCSKAQKANAVIPDEESMRRVYTIRGSTGAVLAATPIRDEDSEALVDMITHEFKESYLESVRAFACDNPSPKLHRALSAVCPNMECLMLDPIHLVMFYVVSHYRKRTDGSRMLLRIQNKFNKVDNTKSVDDWNPYYDGTSITDHTPAELVFRNHILNSSMRLNLAQARLQAIDFNVPYYSSEAWVGDLAALCAVYAGEVCRKTTQQGKVLRTVIWCATAEDKIGYYFNNIRCRHSIQQRRISLLPSGTSSNEALNAEINKWFNTAGAMYLSTLRMSTRVFATAKIIVHGLAMYDPTCIRYSQQDILAKYCAGFTITDAQWNTFISLPSTGPELELRKKTSIEIKKRPSVFLSTRRVRRTPLSLQRKKTKTFYKKNR